MQDRPEVLLDVVSRPVTLGKHTVSISASIGVTFFPRDAADLGTLLHHADRAMCRAKRSGERGYCFFDTVQGGRRRRAKCASFQSADGRGPGFPRTRDPA